MGASQSIPDEPTTTDANASRAIRPYGVTKESKHIPWNHPCRMLYEGVVSLVQDNKYADLVIACEDDKYPVHRAIVCPRSHYFRDYYVENEPRNDFASSATPVKIWIDPSECESHILAAVLTFLYTLDYNSGGPQVLTFGLPESETPREVEFGGDFPVQPDAEEPSGIEDVDTVTSKVNTGMETPGPSSTASKKSTTPPDPSEAPNELVFHFQTYMAAQKFGIESLGQVASEKLKKRLRLGPWKKEMIPCIREVYRCGNRAKCADLKEEIVSTARARFRELKACKGWEDLILDSPEFGAELISRL